MLAGAEGWKERATGDIKLSRDRATGKVRFIVRQEKVLKVSGGAATVCSFARTLTPPAYPVPHPPAL